MNCTQVDTASKNEIMRCHARYLLVGQPEMSFFRTSDQTANAGSPCWRRNGDDSLEFGIVTSKCFTTE